MSNLPLGAENDTSAPFNETSTGLDENCKDCDVPMEYHDSGTIKVCGRAIDWLAFICPECGYIDSNEPDID